jgi:hypothetical protein
MPASADRQTVSIPALPNGKTPFSAAPVPPRNVLPRQVRIGRSFPGGPWPETENGRIGSLGLCQFSGAFAGPARGALRMC